MTSAQTFIVQILSTMAILVPAILGAIKAWRSSGNTDDIKAKSIKHEEQMGQLVKRQDDQDQKLTAIANDTARGFKEAGQHRAQVDKEMAVLHSTVESMQRRVERIPTGSQGGYVRSNPHSDPMEQTPTDRLPAVPSIPPVRTKK